MKQHCEVCETETEWDVSGEMGPHNWCKQCGISQEMLNGMQLPGGCQQHPDATHELGFGLAGGGFGDYKICNECCAVFDKHLWPDDRE